MGKRRVVWWYEQTISEVCLDGWIRKATGNGLSYARVARLKYDSTTARGNHVAFVGYERTAMLPLGVEALYRRTFGPEEVNEMLDVNEWWDARTTLDPDWMWNRWPAKTPFDVKYRKLLGQIGKYTAEINAMQAKAVGSAGRSYASANAPEDMGSVLKWQRDRLGRQIYSKRPDEQIRYVLPPGMGIDLILAGGKWSGWRRFVNQKIGITGNSVRTRRLADKLTDELGALHLTGLSDALDRTLAGIETVRGQ